MPQFNLPRKTVATVQLWAGVILLALALLFSFMPIIKLETLDNIEEIESMVNQVLPEAELDIPEEVDITAPKLVSTISLIVKIVDASISSAKEDEAATDKVNAINDFLKTDEGKEDVATAFCIAATIVKTIDFEGSDNNVLAMILNIIVSVTALFYVLIFTLVLPIILAFHFIISLIKALKNIKTPENASAAIGGKLIGVLSIPLLLMLMQCVVPGMSYGWGIVAVFATVIAATVLGFVISRLREYPAKEFKYVNIVQGTALVAIVGFVVFFFNIIKTGVFHNFANKFAAYMGKVAVAAAEIAAMESAGMTVDKTINGGYIIDAVLMLVYLVVILSCVSYLASAAKRFSCTVKKTRPKVGFLISRLFADKARDGNIVAAIFTAFTFAIPTYIISAKHAFDDVCSTASAGEASLIELTAAQQGALNAALVGIIIMLVAEIALLILKKVFCKDLEADEAEKVIMGLAKTSDEKLEEAKAFIAETEAAEAAKAAKAAPAEEVAPVEETAPAEEATPAEEAAPAEETASAEETPAEDTVTAE